MGLFSFFYEWVVQLGRAVNAYRGELEPLSFLLKAATDHEKVKIHRIRKKEPKLWR